MAALFVDHLTVIDFSFVDLQRGIVGESWIVDVILEGDLDANGMVFDFGDVKKQIKRAIDQSIDHTLAIPMGMPTLRVEKDTDDCLQLRWVDAEGRGWNHSSPPEAVTRLPGEAINPAATARWLESRLRQFVPHNVTGIRIALRTEVIDGAWYHYTHGLKKHLGNCQRIAHGHRSRLELWLDGDRQPALERDWCQRWQDIYVGSREDIVDEFTEDGVEYLQFGYRSNQGPFSLSLPASRVYLIDCDSTVELIAEHMADALARAHPGRRVEVRAFEGVWKGAWAHR